MHRSSGFLNMWYPSLGDILETVIGQERALHFLGGLVEKNRIPHALLLCGPDGTGASAVGVSFARALQCEVGGSTPCLKCAGCHKTGNLNHPDFSILFPFSSRVKEDAIQVALRQVVSDPYGYPLPEDHATISVDQIRGLQRQFAYGAYQGAWRTAVIMHADRMRPESANALLKTLEEPPQRSLMVLVTAQPEAMLPTILSRCQFLKFSPISVSEVQAALAHKGVDEQTALTIARSCGGNFRRAKEMASGDLPAAQERAFRFLEAMIWGAEGRTYAALEQLASDRQAVFDVIKEAEGWLRDALLVQSDRQTQVVHVDRLDDVKRLSQALGVQQLGDIATQLETLREMNHRNVNIQLGLISLWRQLQRNAV